MRISVDIKRIALTALVSSCASIFVCYFVKNTAPTSISIYHFTSAILFSIAIPLTNIDKIQKGKIIDMVLYTILIIFLQLTIISDGAIFIGLMGFGYIYLYAIGPVAGILTLLMYSQFIKVDNRRFGYYMTGLITLTTPLILTVLKELNMFSAGSGYHSMFLIIWQILIGFAIALSIWTKARTKTEYKNDR